MREVIRLPTLYSYVASVEVRRQKSISLVVYKNLFCNIVQPEVCQNIKNMLISRTYPGLRQEEFIFH